MFLVFFNFSSVYWDYAVTVNVEDIVYLHCHQQRKYIPGLVCLFVPLKSKSNFDVILS